MTTISARIRPLAVLVLVASALATGLSAGPDADAASPCPSAPPLVPTIGTNGDDVIIGTDCIDVIWGLGGDDVIWGRGGDDVIKGHGGDDQLHGQGGNDLVFGGSGADTLWGGPGADQLFWGYFDSVPDATPDLEASDTLRVEY